MNHLLAGFFVAAASVIAAPQPPTLRLPSVAQPVRYAVSVTVEPGNDTFEGNVDIEIAFLKSTRLLWLNAAALHIHSAVLDWNGKKLEAHVTPGGEQFVGFEFPQEVSGKGVLHVAYSGAISRNSSAGVFQLKDGENWYVYTQFEPTDARRAFPCFDEPNYKVPWRVTMRVRRSDMALSNTPVESEKDEAGGMKTVRFRETPPLPSYLVAFAAGPFEAVSAGKVGKTPLRVITPKGRAGEAKYAVEAIPPLLQRLEEYFGSPYPFEKLDSIAMPISDFAMENVGLITYGQSLLLSKPESDTILRQREFAETAAHEMAHQWFGDLVTTAWWNEIWLNEAFATWMETKITGEWKPDWNEDVSRVEESQGAMRLDSLVSARKIRQPIESDNDIANAFDGITYQKGAAVINMFENWIGSERFRDGVRIYMKRHAGGNATTAEFLAAIGEAAGKNIAPAFNSFLDQAGVPLVTVSLDCADGKAKAELSQKRSLPIGSPGSEREMWRIPVCLKYDAGGKAESQCEMMTDPKTEVELKHASGCPAWVLPNGGENGYYRVRYADGLLGKAMADGGAHLTLAERAGELGNAGALVATGDVSPAAALGLVPEFSKDTHRQVVEEAAGIAQMLKSDYIPKELRGKGAKFIRDVFGARAAALGWNPRPGDDDDTRLLRRDLVPFVASVGEEKTLVDQAGVLARKWLDDRSAVDPNMLGGVLETAAEFGDQALFDRLLAAVRAEKDRRVRSVLFEALGSFRDPKIAGEAMALLTTGEFDARESFFALLFGPLSYPETRDLPFEFMRKNIDSLAAHVPREVGEDFAANFPVAGEAFCDAKRRDEVKNFFEERVKKYTGGPRTLAQVIERIDVCIGQRQALEPGLKQFLAKY